MDTQNHLWDDKRFNLFKVKAHEAIDEQTYQKLAWKKIGNFVADEVAKSSLKSEVPFVIDMSSKIDSHNIMQKTKLLKVYRYLVDFNRQSQISHENLSQKNKSDVGVDDHNQSNRNRNIRDIMKNWRVQNPRHFAYPNMTLDAAKCCPWGVWSAFMVYRWLQTLEWPQTDEIPREDVGVTFFGTLC